MIKISKLLGMLFLIFSLQILVPAQKKTPNPRPKNLPNDSAIFKNTINSIVLIETVCFDLSIHQATGFIIDDDLVVTNKHAANCGIALVVTDLVSRKKFVVENIYHHPKLDLAILKIPDLHGKENTLKFAAPNSAKVGNPVYVIGNPRGIEGFYSKGNIQKINSDYIWFDAPLDHGSSGSPVLDRYGKVIGVETLGNVINGITFGGAVDVSNVTELKLWVNQGIIVDYIELKKLEKPYQPELEKIMPKPATPVIKKCSVNESLNNKAIFLPRPKKTGPAITVQASGRVDVSVIISENGEVIEAQAENGHPFLRESAAEAAKQAKFPPNMCGEKNAQTQGIITYFFN